MFVAHLLDSLTDFSADTQRLKRHLVLELDHLCIHHQGRFFLRFFRLLLFLLSFKFVLCDQLLYEVLTTLNTHILFLL